MKDLKEQIEVMQHFLNGGEVETTLCGLQFPNWNIDKSPQWNWLNCKYRKKEYQYPIYFKSKNKTLVEFSSLENSKILENGSDCLWAKGENIGISHTKLDKSVWKQVEKPKDKIVMEKWLCRDTINNEYFEYSTSRIDIALNNFAFSTEKIKLLDTYEVEL